MIYHRKCRSCDIVSETDDSNCSTCTGMTFDLVACTCDELENEEMCILNHLGSSLHNEHKLHSKQRGGEKTVCHQYCAECGIIYDEHYPDDDCPVCHCTHWIVEEVICTCLEITSRDASQETIIITNHQCKAHGWS